MKLKMSLILTGCMALFIAGEVAAIDRKYKSSVKHYIVPDLVLINQNGNKIRLTSYVETDQPVILEFIYGTCTTIYPVLSAGFVNLQTRLGPDAPKARLVSITIEPEHDHGRVSGTLADKEKPFVIIAPKPARYWSLSL